MVTSITVTWKPKKSQYEVTSTSKDGDWLGEGTFGWLWEVDGVLVLMRYMMTPYMVVASLEQLKIRLTKRYGCPVNITDKNGSII